MVECIYGIKSVDARGDTAIPRYVQQVSRLVAGSNECTDVCTDV